VGETYHPVEQSNVLPGIDLKQLARFIDSPTTSQAIVEYQESTDGLT
jgi:hypothetical protein